MAQLVARRLAHGGIEAYLDVDVLEPGMDWEEEVRTKLERSDAVVAILSAASSESIMVGYELGAAKVLNKRVMLIQQDTTRSPYSVLSNVKTLDAKGMSADEIADNIRAQLAA
jgi:hypothetical protein